MKRVWRRYQLWIFYAVFIGLAMAFGSREGFATTDGPYAGAKLMIFAGFIAFLGYSLYATARENFFKTLGTVNRLLWGRQIGIDLYISVTLSLMVIFMVEGSVLVTALWALPVLVFANLAILPYLLLNFAEVIAHFGG